MGEVAKPRRHRRVNGDFLTSLQSWRRLAFYMVTSRREEVRMIRRKHRSRGQNHRGREIHRRKWDRRHLAPSEISDDRRSGPFPPEAVHQGRYIYHSKGMRTEG